MSIVRRRNRVHRRGAMLVEFALVAPILFLLFFAMIEFGRFNFIRHGIDTAAYEGARSGIVPGATVNDVTASVNSILDAAFVSKSTVTVVPTVITSQTTEVTVKVEVALAENGWVIPRFFKQTTLTRTCTLAREQLDSY